MSSFSKQKPKKKKAMSYSEEAWYLTKIRKEKTKRSDCM